MKNKDIQRAAKINGLDIMNGHALHLIFPSLPSPYYKKQNISKDAA
jgi:hypothetical protein